MISSVEPTTTDTENEIFMYWRLSVDARQLIYTERIDHETLEEIREDAAIIANMTECPRLKAAIANNWALNPPVAAVSLAKAPKC